jgi:hypothetical protein
MGLRDKIRNHYFSLERAEKNLQERIVNLAQETTTNVPGFTVERAAKTFIMSARVSVSRLVFALSAMIAIR